MIRIRNLIGLVAIAALIWAAPHQARAASQMLCAPTEAGKAEGARRIVNPNTSNAYSLNSDGCAVIQQADVGWALSQGFVPAGDQNVAVFTTGVATGTTDFVIGTLPAGWYISQVVATNATANAVTGNISIGSTANGTDIVASLACAANCVATAPGATTIAKPAFSTTTATTLHAAAITAWNNANVTFTIVMRPF